ncbi:hypothetical protein [Agrobacterium sp. S7/73]|uniref:hypothetical protein n=1 Tax=Agrobacterium sp. S7/73 TaxID=2820002 RepID=UPI001C5B7471|nr:hypothetical protein [Agrobacterium sp. S7/73]QXZ71834.1 hypothetical protein J5276_12145 [Agrobacterium sp. S7/73]QXZ74622.1 hypothetical protein J5276_18760 [Agrobacterium sp. S7/73]
MTAVRNYVAVPFFDRVPPRIMDLVITTFDNIVERGQSVREAYYFFGNAVKKRNLEGPTFDDFAHWHERVKNGLIERPHPSEVQPVAVTRKQLLTAVSNISDEAANQLRVSSAERPTITKIVQRSGQDMACEVARSPERTLRLEQARAVVKAAHDLFETKRKAGYSPDSIIVEDTIVAEALRDLLEAEAEHMVTDVFVDMTPGNMLVDFLLSEQNEDIDAKLIDCLTIDMQPELCHILSRPGTLKSR